MGFSTATFTNLTANTKSANLLSGNVNEFVSEGGHVNFYAVTNASGIKLTVYADSDIIIDDQEITFIDSTLSLKKSDYMLDSIVVSPGSRLSCYVRETAGVSTTDGSIGVEVA